VNHGAILTADRHGNPDGAYLVGNHGHLAAPDSPSLNMTDAFTISAWIRQDGMESPFATIVGKGRNTEYSACVYYGGSWDCPDPAADRRVQVTVGGASAGFGSAPDIDCGLGEWRHLVVTVAPPVGGLYHTTLYLDGVEEGSTDLAGAFSDTDAPLGIGKDGATDFRFVGAVDDVRVYNRALSPAEVAELYLSLLVDGFESGSLSAWSSHVP
jgi:hypothetical protein